MMQTNTNIKPDEIKLTKQPNGSYELLISGIPFIDGEESYLGNIRAHKVILGGISLNYGNETSISLDETKMLPDANNEYFVIEVANEN